MVCTNPDLTVYRGNKKEYWRRVDAVRKKFGILGKEGGILNLNKAAQKKYFAAVDAALCHTLENVEEKDGYIFIKDRKKDLIISKGINIYPREIGEILQKNPYIKAAAVIGEKDKEGEEHPAAYIELEEGIKTNITLVFSPLQALLAAKAVATYVSPFVGRLDDIGHDGMELISQIVQIYDNYGFDTEIIVASIRHPQHVLQAALIGADIATIPFKVIKQLAKHPLTDVGLQRFLEDWAKVPDRDQIFR